MQPFIAFGFSHLAVLALTLTGGVGLGLVARRMTDTGRRTLRYFLAVLVALNWIALLVIFYAKGWTTRGNLLPMQLCDWATIAVLVTLIRPTPLSYALAYFWALGGTLQGLLSPSAVTRDYPDAAFILFFSFHALILIAVGVLTLGCRFRPTSQILPRVILWSLIYMAAAGAVNVLLGTNYGFLAEKPPSPTPYDLMPEWPLYLPLVVLLGMGSVLAYYAPFFILDRWKARQGYPGNS